jgi:hypothetical protein
MDIIDQYLAVQTYIYIQESYLTLDQEHTHCPDLRQS